MSTLKTNTIEPATGTNLTLGASGDVVTVPSDSIQLNTWKDSGGNTLFVSDGSGNLSSINSALSIGGGPNLILSQTASASSSISFTSGIDSTYDKYMFVFTDINPATDGTSGALSFQVNAAGQTGFNETMTTTAFQAYHAEDNSAAALSYDAGLDQQQGTSYQKFTESTGNGGDECLAGIFYLFAPSSTTYVKQFYATTCSYYHANYMFEEFIAGYINTTLAITEIDFKMPSGNFDGTIKMYGCR